MTEQDFTLTVERDFNFPAEQVFDAWLNPASVRHWLFATPDGEMKNVEIDPRTGGRYRIDEQREDGLWSQTGEYLVIDRPHRLQFTLCVLPDDPPARITINISATESGCHLQLVHEMPEKWTNYREEARKGWTAILTGLDQTLGV